MVFGIYIYTPHDWVLGPFAFEVQEARCFAFGKS